MSHTEVMEESDDAATAEQADGAFGPAPTRTPEQVASPGLPDAPTLDDVLAEAGALIDAAEFLESCAAADGFAGGADEPVAARAIADEARSLSNDIDRAIGADAHEPLGATAPIAGTSPEDRAFGTPAPDRSGVPSGLDVTEAMDRAIEETLRTDPDEEVLGTYEPIESVLAQAFDQEALSREFQSVDDAEREERGEVLGEVSEASAEALADPGTDTTDEVSPSPDAIAQDDDRDALAALAESLAADADSSPTAAEPTNEPPSSEPDPEPVLASEPNLESEPTLEPEPESSLRPEPAVDPEPVDEAEVAATAPAPTAEPAVESPAPPPRAVRTAWVHQLAEVAAMPMRRIPSHARPLVDLAALSLLLWVPLVWWMALQPPPAPITAAAEAPGAAAEHASSVGGSDPAHGGGKASSASHGAKKEKSGGAKKPGAEKKSGGHGGH